MPTTSSRSTASRPRPASLPPDGAPGRPARAARAMVGARRPPIAPRRRSARSACPSPGYRPSVTRRVADELDRGRPPSVTRVVDLGAVRDRAADVHLCPQVHVVAGLRPAMGDRGRPVGGDGHVHEEVELGDDGLSSGDRTARGPGGSCRDSWASPRRRRGGGSTRRGSCRRGVGAAAGVGPDREEPPAQVRGQAVAGHGGHPGRGHR
jgi:hypothetical protein